jgi:alpha-galactosidase
MYRQDFNSDPAPAWNARDSAGRIGITENDWVRGYLNYWDKLIERYPDMMIDSCASGGGRNDLETMRRSVPLHFSDAFDTPAADYGYDEKLGVSQALFQWLPYFKNNLTETRTDYKLRANYAPWFVISTPWVGDASKMQNDYDFAPTLKAQEEFNQIRDYYYGDYYQLTPCTQDPKEWKGWQFFDTKKNAGFAQLFRPDGALQQPALKVKFFGLQSGHEYTVYDFDGKINLKATGKSLMEIGITVTLFQPETSALILIKP